MPRDRDGGLILQGNMMKVYRKEAIDEEYTISQGKVRAFVCHSEYSEYSEYSE